MFKKWFIKKYILPHIENMKKLQMDTANCYTDSYDQGMYNGIELVYSIFANTDGEFISLKKNTKK